MRMGTLKQKEKHYTETDNIKNLDSASIAALLRAPPELLGDYKFVTYYQQKHLQVCIEMISLTARNRSAMCCVCMPAQGH